MDHVEAEQHRNAVPVAVDGESIIASVISGRSECASDHYDFLLRAFPHPA